MAGGTDNAEVGQAPTDGRDPRDGGAAIETLTDIDLAFGRVQREADVDAFADWMGRAERPIRASLRRFARVVDIEVVVQETLMRMWSIAQSGRLLEGRDASLRFAIGVARNVAREEVRRARLGHVLPLENLPETAGPSVDPDPPSDPALRRAIEECFSKMPDRPRHAMMLRISSGHQMHDRDLAITLDMKINTFLQHIVRARLFLAGCLERKGVVLREVLS